MGNNKKRRPHKKKPTQGEQAVASGSAVESEDHQGDEKIEEISQHAKGENIKDEQKEPEPVKAVEVVKVIEKKVQEEPVKSVEIKNIDEIKEMPKEQPKLNDAIKPAEQDDTPPKEASMHLI
jgi:hypothetical protein